MTITVFRDASGQWGWYLRTPTGEFVSRSREKYESKGWAVHMATSLYPGATLHLEDTQTEKES